MSLMKEALIASILVVLLALVANPFHWWMPSMMLMVVLVGILAAFAVFAAFILREGVRDEREAMHRMFAGRVAFLSGAAVLTGGIVYQELYGTLDVWLVVALVVMVLTKIGTILYSDSHN